VYNIKKAVSRLDFAPKIDAVKVIDIKRGIGEFTPKPDKVASFAALKETLKKAGYTLASAEITVVGTLVHDNDKWLVEVESSKQQFALEGANIDKMLQGFDAGTRVELTGDWQTVGKEPGSREVIGLRSAKKITAAPTNSGAASSKSKQDQAALENIQVSLGGSGNDSGLYFSSIRTTSPGLTVYKGARLRRAISILASISAI
jgi:hypothetical protein